jgi:hypothetical protein
VQSGLDKALHCEKIVSVELIADVLVAVVKLCAALFTASASMAAGAVHSMVDVVVVALLFLTLRSGFSMIEGVRRMIDPAEVRSPIVIYIVLAAEALLDAVSWPVALKALRSAKGDLGYCQAMKSSEDPPSCSVLARIWRARGDRRRDVIATHLAPDQIVAVLSLEFSSELCTPECS